MFKYLFKRDTFFATLAVFVLMGLFALIPINTHFLDPLHLALADFNYNDLAYSQLHKNERAAPDTNIVIVNIEQAGRADIAAMIELIDAKNPKVIGVDVLFDHKKDSTADALLAKQFATNKRLVGVYNFNGHLNKGYFYDQTLAKGFANFVGEEEGVIRHVMPSVKDDHQEYTAFALQVVKKANEGSYNELLARKKLTETINYSRNADKYVVVDGMAMLNNDIDAAVLANKIVLIGYVGANSFDIEDKHFTPMNEKVVGKSAPDMNGIFIHANIISMVLAKDYIHHVPTWLMWTIAFLLCWLHMAFFIKAFLEAHLWFHLKAKIAQILSAVLFLYLGLMCFYKLDLQLNMTATLAAIILAVDVLYFYEAFAIWLHKKKGFKTIFIHAKHG